MSGNPFRASLVVQNHPTVAPSTSSPPADSSNREDERADRREHGFVLEASSAPPQKTKKSVRIESPTEVIPPHPVLRNTDGEGYTSSDHRHDAGFLSPGASPALDRGFEKRYLQDTAGTEADGRATAASVSRNPEGSASAHFPNAAPANPFSRTLATIEPQEQPSEATEQLKAERIATDKSISGGKRQSLNVEGFKNLLMQGIASPRSSGPPRQSAPASNPSSLPLATFESSSTDTSSISRQSIFDATQDSHPESPRTSYDMALSDDEHNSLMGGEVRKEKKKPPPAPRHRHGKLVKERTPQTVSFDDFSATNASVEHDSSQKNGTNLSKPLPPTPPNFTTPPARAITQDSNQDGSSLYGTNDEAGGSLSGADTISKPVQKKVPPPVPLARRQSQLRGSITGNRSRSNSSLTVSSQQSIEAPVISYSQENASPHQASSQKAPPPPLPARRHGSTLPVTNATSADSSSGLPRSVVASPNTPSRRTTLESQPATSVPISGLTRTSSKHSPRNASRAVSNESMSGVVGMPPPPPPPRRRQSGRSSLDMQRPSLPPGSPSPVNSRQASAEWKRDSRTSFDGKRQGSIASVSSLSREYTPDHERVLHSPREKVDGSDGIRAERHSGPDEQTDGTRDSREEGSGIANNILDDMEKFQQEIDELRSRFEKAA